MRHGLLHLDPGGGELVDAGPHGFGGFVGLGAEDLGHLGGHLGQQVTGEHLAGFQHFVELFGGFAHGARSNLEAARYVLGELALQLLGHHRVFADHLPQGAQRAFGLLGAQAEHGAGLRHGGEDVAGFLPFQAGAARSGGQLDVVLPGAGKLQPHAFGTGAHKVHFTGGIGAAHGKVQAVAQLVHLHLRLHQRAGHGANLILQGDQAHRHAAADKGGFEAVGQGGQRGAGFGGFFGEAVHLFASALQGFLQIGAVTGDLDANDIAHTAPCACLLFVPGVQCGALHGLQAAKGAGQVTPLDAGHVAQIGQHAGVVQAGAPGHAIAPLGLQAVPQSPGAEVVWPEAKACIGRALALALRLQAQGGGGFVKLGVRVIVWSLGDVQLAAGPQPGGPG